MVRPTRTTIPNLPVPLNPNGGEKFRAGWRRIVCAADECGRTILKPACHFRAQLPHWKKTIAKSRRSSFTNGSARVRCTTGAAAGAKETAK